MRGPQVVVVGPAYLDVVAAPMGDWPELGREFLTGGIELAAGGFAIAALALRRLGVEVLLGTAVGGDGPGRYLTHLLQAEGVAQIGPAPARTPVTIALNHLGDRAFVTAGPPADDQLAAGGLAALRAAPSARWLHLSGRGPWAAEVAAQARSSGLYVSLDCGTDPAWLASKDFRALLGQVDAYLPNAREATCVTGEDDPERAAAALCEFVPRAIVKLGPGGVLAAGADGLRHHPTQALQAVDATGAGDVFDAGYIAGSLWGFDEAAAVRLGQFAAGAAIGALGGATAAPTRWACVEGLPDLPWSRMKDGG